MPHFISSLHFLSRKHCLISPQRVIILSMKKRHPFLLLELLIALSLFSLCIVPLVQLPFRTLREATLYYQRLELERLTDVTLAQIEARLFQNEIPWKDLECNRKNKYLISEATVEVDVTGERKAPFKKTCFLWTARKKKGGNGEHYRLLTVEVLWTPLASKKQTPPFFKRYHQILVQQLPFQAPARLSPPLLPEASPQRVPQKSPTPIAAVLTPSSSA